MPRLSWISLKKSTISQILVNSFLQNKIPPFSAGFYCSGQIYIIPIPGMPPGAAATSASGISTTKAPIVAAVDAIDTAF